MNQGEAIQARLDLKELELTALLEITQAINNNLPEESLYKIYGFTVRGNLNIRKLALYVLDDEWECKVNFGTKSDFKSVPFDERFLDYIKTSSMAKSSDSEFNEFNVIIPIAHKDQKLAFVFICGYNPANDEGINTNFIQALSNIIIVAIENKKLVRQQMEQEMFQRELKIAENVQQFLLTKNLPDTEEIKVDSYYRPHHSIGGDYYDFIEINDHQILFCIADVSGKGIPAALLMSNFQASLRTLTRQTSDLKEIITELNHQVMSNAEGQHFITFFVAIYDKESMELKYVNSGHNPPVLVHDGKLQMLEEGSTILGAFHELPFLNVGTIEGIGEFLFCGFTDGLTELNNSKGEEFGTDELLKVIKENSGLEPAELNALIVKSMDRFKEENSFNDDITLFTCKVNHKK